MPNVLILGAGSDLAIALARKFASEKYSLSLAGRNIPEINGIANDLRIRYSVPAEAYAFDAAAFSSHAAFYQNLKCKPDIAICVFGYMGDNEEAMANWAESARTIDTNYSGAVSILNILALEGIKTGSGTLVGISSVAGERGRGSNFIYGSAKAGFTAYLSGLRNKLAKSGVHVLTVKPGFMYTRMTENLPLPALLTVQPEQAAEAIFKAIAAKKNTVYVKGLWRYIMLIIKSIPEPVFKKLSL